VEVQHVAGQRASTPAEHRRQQNRVASARHRLKQKQAEEELRTATYQFTVKKHLLALLERTNQVEIQQESDAIFRVNVAKVGSCII
jgi:hypothetical protein